MVVTVVDMRVKMSPGGNSLPLVDIQSPVPELREQHFCWLSRETRPGASPWRAHVEDTVGQATGSVLAVKGKRSEPSSELELPQAGTLTEAVYGLSGWAMWKEGSLRRSIIHGLIVAAEVSGPPAWSCLH